MFGIFFNEHEVWNFDDSCASDQEAFKVWFKSMLEQGIYLAPSQFETLFMSGAHTDEDIDPTLRRARPKSFIVTEDSAISRELRSLFVDDLKNIDDVNKSIYNESK